LSIKTAQVDKAVMLPLKREASAAPAGSATERTLPTLVAACLEPNYPLHVRKSVIQQALISRDPQLGELLVRGIQQVDRANFEWRALLVEAAEVRSWPAGSRSEIADVLSAEALALSSERATGFERLLAIAVRTVALIADTKTAISLIIRLLAASELPATKQAALAAVRVLYSVHPPRPGDEKAGLSSLQRRLSELLATYVHDELFSTSQIGALILSAYAACAATCHPELERYATRAIEVLPPLMCQQIVYLIEDIRRKWGPKAAVPGVERTLETLRAKNSPAR